MCGASMKSQWLTAVEAILWIATRNERSVLGSDRENRDEDPRIRINLFLARYRVGDGENRRSLVLSGDESIRALEEACASGEVIAKGAYIHGGVREEIPSDYWTGTSLFPPATGARMERRLASMLTRRRRDLVFSRDSILKAFPAPVVMRPDESGSSSPTEAPPLGEQKSPQVTTPTKKDLERVYLERIQQYVGRTPPTREEDVAYIQGLYPKVKRDRVRELRDQLAPEEWKQRGRRKSAQ